MHALKLTLSRLDEKHELQCTPCLSNPSREKSVFDILSVFLVITRL